ncbi:hypothetical protein KR054_012118 [Drosophila jambulina]|nr:hypothetical protein KR054_012118 [Drosophila jambulina]
MALAAHHHQHQHQQQHHHQQQQPPPPPSNVVLAGHHHQQLQPHQHHQQQPPPPSQQQQQQQHLQDGSPHHHHHFNVAALGDLSGAMQLGAVTADGSFVTMGGVVVGRIQHTREELQQLGVIKVESPSNGVTTATTSAAASTQREG